MQRFLDGQIRVPSFQRALRWRAKDVLRLLDSVYRGFPIGSLLMWKRRAEPERVRVGPFDMKVDARDDAWFVVDGQQRLTSLVGALRHPGRFEAETPPDAFTLAFDLRDDVFRLPGERSASPSPARVPVHRLFDAVELADWLSEHPEIGTDRDLARRAHTVGKALREYRVPVYVIETDDQDVLREVFERTNSFGMALTQAEVFDALVGSRSGPTGSGERISDLVSDLRRLRMGTVDEELGFRLVLAVEGLDVTRSFKGLNRDERDALRGATPKASSGARTACEFLRASASIPHLRLLAYSWPLVVLTRFFYLHPLATSRSRELLSRWLWRGVTRAPGGMDERTLLRRAIRAIEQHDQSEEDAVEALLELVPGRETETHFDFPARFDARTAPSRIIMTALADLKPRHLENGGIIDVTALLGERDVHAFSRIVAGDGDGAGQVGNRALHERVDGGLFELVRRRAEVHIADAVLRSHAISEECAVAALRGDRGSFIAHRELDLIRLMPAFLAKMTRFGYGDRKSLAILLAEAEQSTG